jgi:hypothetical protein
MKQLFFKLLVKLNGLILPSYYKRDPLRLSNLQKAILAFRYWALTNSLR